MAARWRNAASRAGRAPGWLRRRLAAPAEQDALAHLIAHLSDEEVSLVIGTPLACNPSLTLGWADDLCAEHRCGEDVTRCLEGLRRRATAYDHLSTALEDVGAALYVPELAAPLQSVLASSRLAWL